MATLGSEFIYGLSNIPRHPAQRPPPNGDCYIDKLSGPILDILVEYSDFDDKLAISLLSKKFNEVTFRHLFCAFRYPTTDREVNHQKFQGVVNSLTVTYDRARNPLWWNEMVHAVYKWPKLEHLRIEDLTRCPKKVPYLPVKEKFPNLKTLAIHRSVDTNWQIFDNYINDILQAFPMLSAFSINLDVRPYMSSPFLWLGWLDSLDTLHIIKNSVNATDFGELKSLFPSLKHLILEAHMSSRYYEDLVRLARDIKSLRTLVCSQSDMVHPSAVIKDLFVRTNLTRIVIVHRRVEHYSVVGETFGKGDEFKMYCKIFSTKQYWDDRSCQDNLFRCEFNWAAGVWPDSKPCAFSTLTRQK